MFNLTLRWKSTTSTLWSYSDCFDTAFSSFLTHMFVILMLKKTVNILWWASCNFPHFLHVLFSVSHIRHFVSNTFFHKGVQKAIAETKFKIQTMDLTVWLQMHIIYSFPVTFKIQIVQFTILFIPSVVTLVVLKRRKEEKCWKIKVFLWRKKYE